MSSIASAYVFPSSTADAELQGRVVAYLASRNFHSFRRLSVRAKRGVISLRGRLGSYYERQVAIESARRVAGVTRIVDRIVVDAVSDRVLTVPKFARAMPNSDVLVDFVGGVLERFDVALASIDGSTNRS
jgi:hypothetical protein